MSNQKTSEYKAEVRVGGIEVILDVLITGDPWVPERAELVAAVGAAAAAAEKIIRDAITQQQQDQPVPF